LRSPVSERESPPKAVEPASRWGALRHRDFRLLWAARTVSSAGDRITLLALPSTAILVLGASAGQVGALNAVAFLAWPVLGLFVGVWVDRLRRRPILIAADLGRALLIGSIPAAYALRDPGPGATPGAFAISRSAERGR